MKMRNLPKKLRALKDVTGVDLLILFGSYAHSNERKGSDLDVAVLSKKPIQSRALCEKIGRLTQIDQIDLVDLRRCDPLLGMKIIQEGAIAIEKKRGMFPEIASYIARRYADTKKFRDL